AAIGAAREHVHAEYYIFRADRAGERIRDALCERARARVKVRLLVDALGTRRWPGAFRQPLVEAGVELATFNSAVPGSVDRGVDVRLLVPARTDSRLVDAASRTYWEPLFRVGVQIYEYTPRMVHAKTAVVDHWLAIVGTANLDYRSLRLNFEVGALLYGRRTV